MASKSSYLIGGLAILALMVAALPALPAAQGIGASAKAPPAIQVNRGAKGDRLVEPRTIAVKKAPTETARDTIKSPEQSGKRRIMDGCDPMFSPVTVPALAHVAGRCVG
jgi:hypothetical protein